MTKLDVTRIVGKSAKTKSSEEFDKYLKRQCLRTTFNGLEIEAFGWYKKMFGIV